MDRLTSQSAHRTPPPPVDIGRASRFPANTGQASSSCGPSHSSHLVDPSSSLGGDGYSSAVCTEPVSLLRPLLDFDMIEA